LIGEKGKNFEKIAQSAAKNMEVRKLVKKLLLLQCGKI